MGQDGACQKKAVVSILVRLIRSGEQGGRMKDVLQCDKRDSTVLGTAGGQSHHVLTTTPQIQGEP